jgi:hypothetical protein
MGILVHLVMTGLWRVEGIRVGRRKPNGLENNVLLSHFSHHKFHTDYIGIGAGHLE